MWFNQGKVANLEEQASAIGWRQMLTKIGVKVAIAVLTQIFRSMAEKGYADQAFVENVVKALVEHPDEVKAERSVDEMGVLLTLHINPADMGQVIGRSGRTARALRTLLRIVGAKHNARVNLKIYEPEGARPEGRRPMGGTRHDADDDAGVEDLKL